MPHFYRTPAKFRAVEQSKGNHASCFRVEENCLTTSRPCFFPSGTARVGSSIMDFFLWSAKYLSGGHHTNHNGELTDQGGSLNFWIFEGCFFSWFAWRNDPNHLLPGHDQLSWVTQDTCLISGRWLQRVVCQLNSLPIYKTAKILLKGFSLFFSQPTKKMWAGRSPLSFANQEKGFQWVQSEG